MNRALARHFVDKIEDLDVDTMAKVIIDGNAAVQREAGLFRQLKRWPHTDPYDHQVGLNRCS